MNKLQKTLASGAIIATLAIGSFGTAFAQDDANATEPTALCAPAITMFEGERPERQSWWEAVGLTQDDVQAYLDESEDNTLQTLRDQYADELEAFQAEREAERDAMKAEQEAEMINCLNDAVTNGDLTQEQADALIQAIEADSVRDVLESELFDGVNIQIFPRGPRGEMGEHGEFGQGGRGPGGEHGEGGRGKGGERGRDGRGFGAPNTDANADAETDTSAQD